MRDETKEMIRQQLEILTPPEREILSMRFGLEGEAPMTVAEVAKEMKVSKARIKAFERRAVDKVKMACRGDEYALPAFLGIQASKQLPIIPSKEAALNEWMDALRQHGREEEDVDAAQAAFDADNVVKDPALLALLPLGLAFMRRAVKAADLPADAVTEDLLLWPLLLNRLMKASYRLGKTKRK